MANTEKTVIEWLNEAKEQGYEWAQIAIDLVNNGIKASDYGRNDNLAPSESAYSLSKAVNSFYWRATPQGFDFWDEIYESLKEKEL